MKQEKTLLKIELNVSQRLFKSLTPEEHLAAISFVNRDGWNRAQDLEEDFIIHDTSSTWSRVPYFPIAILTMNMVKGPILVFRCASISWIPVGDSALSD